MTLPFTKDDGKRKYRCFCCGKEQTSYEEYATHIKEEHEEGRDYVACPLERCQAPVRDIRSHFKAKHKNEKIPGGYQLKAIIWRDPRGPKGELKTRKPKFQEGVFISNKMNGKEVRYRSGYERQIYELLEQLDEVIAYDTENIRIKYFFEGEHRTYLPDLWIAFNDGTVELWEIKPATQTALPINEAKRAAAIEYCKMRGWKYDMKTEVGINKLRMIVKNREISSRQEEIDSQEQPE